MCLLSATVSTLAQVTILSLSAGSVIIGTQVDYNTALEQAVSTELQALADAIASGFSDVLNSVGLLSKLLIRVTGALGSFTTLSIVGIKLPAPTVTGPPAVGGNRWESKTLTP